MASAEERIGSARRALALLNFDRERTNERSALVLLALLQLEPDDDWKDATNPRLRTVEIMEWIRQKYGRDYKPNTRETIRRQTLHQFVDAALVALNPDDPQRAINSPKNCYQIEATALELLRRFGTDEDLSDQLVAYLDELPGLRAQYERARELEQIPVTLPDGSAVTLTPGGQNVLLKAMIEDFCSRFTKGGLVLYVGDAGKDDPIFEEAMLLDLGVTLDKHGKLPDLMVISQTATGWCCLRLPRPTARSTANVMASCAASSREQRLDWCSCPASRPALRCAST